MKTKKEIIKEMFEKGILLNEELLNNELENPGLDDTIKEKIKAEEDLIVLNSDAANVIKQQTNLVDWYEVDNLRVKLEQKENDELYQHHLQKPQSSNLKINSDILCDAGNLISGSNQDLSAEQINQEINNLEINLQENNKLSSFDYNHKKASNIDESAKENFRTNNLSEKNENGHRENLDNLEHSDLITHNLTANQSEENLFSPQKVEIIVSYENKPYKYEIKDFANIFTSRYHFLEKILRTRQELKGITTINRIKEKKEKESVALIGIIVEIGVTKNGHFMITLEDLTGIIKVLITKNNKENYELAKELIVDEVIGISGTNGDNIVFADNIIWPDVPNTNEMKEGVKDEAAIFLSDIHLGSNVFLKKEFKKFLSWLRGEVGNEDQKELAKKIKYILIAGDVVDGIGVYPTHEEELEITDIKEQYEEFSKLLKEIPQDKNIIICPGNHDMVHLAEPQPVFYKEYCPSLHELPNVTLVTNPAIVNIGKSAGFSGFNVLMYHGYSFDYYVNTVESIRNNGGYHRADLIMKFLLKRRHLAPAFKSTPYFPGHKEDPLLIKIIPDFFLTGHIHYSKVANYKGITMISGSCWQGKTTFQEKLGHEPEPARVPYVNLKTREVKILKFI